MQRERCLSYEVSEDLTNRKSARFPVLARIRMSRLEERRVIYPSDQSDPCNVGHEVVLGVLEVREYKATLYKAIEERRVAMSRQLRAP